MNVIDFESDSTPQKQMNFRQKMVVLTIDLLMVIELCIGMYAASLSPDSFTTSFVKTFICFLIPTLGVGIFLIRRFKSEPPSFA